LHMEHRCGTRSSINHTVRVSIERRPSFIAHLRDVSASGAFLIVPSGAPYLAEVRVTLRVRCSRRVEEAVLRGLAVRNATNGIGVEWLEFAPRCIRNLMQGLAVALQPNDEHATASTFEQRERPVPQCTLATR
jgi:hypothetical protein